MQAPRPTLDALRAELRRQQEGYRSELPARLAELEASWCLVRTGAPGAQAALDALRRAAHTMHGTGGTFGLREFGQACAALEEAADRMLEQPGEHALPALHAAMLRVRHCIAAAQAAPQA